jgi:hypothetical protein
MLNGMQKACSFSGNFGDDYFYELFCKDKNVLAMIHAKKNYPNF